MDLVSRRERCGVRRVNFPAHQRGLYASVRPPATPERGSSVWCRRPGVRSHRSPLPICHRLWVFALVWTMMIPAETGRRRGADRCGIVAVPGVRGPVSAPAVGTISEGRARRATERLGSAGRRSADPRRGDRDEEHGRWRRPGACRVDRSPSSRRPPMSPRRPSSMSSWRDGLRALPSASDDTVRVLAGDVNATLDHAETRRVLDRGYTDAAARLGRGLTGTWPVGGPLPMAAIDHVLVDERVSVDGLEVLDVPGTTHRALAVRLTLPGGAV
ncbi:endonuclease/exonuclease/phosphatase family protein [Nocardiopsis sp. NPDC007018]|uniref:endonuclease/exonuclease/phosphatase family protein n=1 Tax=Nocardiopsis sp. NPDC007018 TaxID=3155721 RepID=UPI0033F6CBB9